MGNGHLKRLHCTDRSILTGTCQKYPLEGHSSWFLGHLCFADQHASAFFSGTMLLYPGENLSRRAEEVGLYNQVLLCF